jgi:hypothetical protein
MMIRRAQLVADAVAVLCPYCGEPQPNKVDGSEQWTADNFAAILGKPRIVCVACDKPMLAEPDSKVQFCWRDVVR